MNHKYIESVITISLNVAKCIGCEMCKIVCPHRVFDIKDRKAFFIRRERCMECGACANNCPVDAITLNSGVG